MSLAQALASVGDMAPCCQLLQASRPPILRTKSPEFHLLQNIDVLPSVVLISKRAMVPWKSDATKCCDMVRQDLQWIYKKIQAAKALLAAFSCRFCRFWQTLRRKPPADCRSSDSNSPIFHPAPCTRPHPRMATAAWPRHGHRNGKWLAAECLNQAIAAGLAQTGRNALLQTWENKGDDSGLPMQRWKKWAVPKIETSETFLSKQMSFPSSQEHWRALQRTEEQWRAVKNSEER